MRTRTNRLNVLSTHKQNGIVNAEDNSAVIETPATRRTRVQNVFFVTVAVLIM